MPNSRLGNHYHSVIGKLAEAPPPEIKRALEGIRMDYLPLGPIPIEEPKPKPKPKN